MPAERSPIPELQLRDPDGQAFCSSPAFPVDLFCREDRAFAADTLRTVLAHHDTSKPRPARATHFLLHADLYPRAPSGLSGPKGRAFRPAAGAEACHAEARLTARRNS